MTRPSPLFIRHCQTCTAVFIFRQFSRSNVDGFEEFFSNWIQIEIHVTWWVLSGICSKKPYIPILPVFRGTFCGNFVWHQLLFPNGGKKPDSSWVKQNRQRSHCREKLHSLKRIMYRYALALSTVYAKGSKTVLKIFFLYLGKLYSFLNT